MNGDLERRFVRTTGASPMRMTGLGAAYLRDRAADGWSRYIRNVDAPPCVGLHLAPCARDGSNIARPAHTNGGRNDSKHGAHEEVRDRGDRRPHWRRGRFLFRRRTLGHPLCRRGYGSLAAGTPRADLTVVRSATSEWSAQRLLLSISRDQVRDSPGIDTHQPVSRRQERDCLHYYGYPDHWGHADLGDTHLRSTVEVSGYAIRALDGDLGHVENILFDDISWAIRYFVVDTSNWWFGKRVLVAPEWIADISWPDRSVSVKVTRRLLKSATQYDRAQHIDRQWEADYYQHLRQPGYWLTEEDARAIKKAQSYLARRHRPARGIGGKEVAAAMMLAHRDGALSVY